MTVFANGLLENNGIIVVGSNGVARMRTNPSAPNGVNIGASILVSTISGVRKVSITLPVADYSAYPLMVLFWLPGNGLTDWWPFAPASGTTVLGTEADVFGRCVGTLPAFYLCPVDSSNRMGAPYALQQATDETPPVLTSVIADGSGFAETLYTAVVEATGTATITYTYQWYLDSVAVGAATASTYTPPASAIGKSLTVKVIPTNSYGSGTEVESDAVALLALEYAAPNEVTFTVAAGSGAGEVDITITALPTDDGDGAVAGDGAGVLASLYYTLNGAPVILLTASPALTTYTITTSPGTSGTIGIYAVNDYDRSGPIVTSSYTATGTNSNLAPVYLGGLNNMEIDAGVPIVFTWSDYFSDATSYVVNTGLTGGVSSGTGDVTYTVSSPVAETVTMSVTATNSLAPPGANSTTWTFNIISETPQVAALLYSDIPGLFVVPLGSSIDYDITQHFRGTSLTYAVASGTLPTGFALSAGGRLTNTSPLSTLITPVSITISADNAAGPAAVSNIVSMGVITTPPTALTVADIAVSGSVYRYAGKWRTPRLYPTELQLITLGANPVSFSAANTSATVVAAGHSIEVGQTFQLPGLTSVQGVSMSGTFVADSVVASTSITFTAASAATGAGSGGGSVGVLTPLWAGIGWSRDTPDANGVIATGSIELAVTAQGLGEYQLFMATSAYNADPDTQQPRRNFSVWNTDTNDTFRIYYQVIPNGPFSAWSPAVTVPIIVPSVATAGAIKASPRTKESYNADIVGDQGQQYQRLRTWNLGIIDPAKRGWVLSHQDENSFRLCKNGNAGETTNPALWGHPRLDGYHAGKSGGCYFNTDDNGGAGLFVAVGGFNAVAGFGWDESAIGVYVGDGTLNYAKKLTITRPDGPGPASGSNVLAWTETSGVQVRYFGNTYDRNGNFIARRPQVPELQTCTVFKTTKLLLDADLAYAAGTKAAVYADGTPANRAVYTKTGASGSGSWTKTITFLTDAERPIYIVEQHGDRKGGVTYQALFRSTDAAVSFSRVMTLPAADFRNGGNAIYFALCAPNGDLMLIGGKGASLFQANSSGAISTSYTSVYSREVSNGHFFGGDSTTASGARLGDATETSNGGVWATTNVRTTAFARKTGTGLPANFNVWDMACAPTNTNRLLVNTDNNLNAYLSTNGGTSFTALQAAINPGDSDASRYSFGGGVSFGHSGFLFCPTNELRVCGWTNQTVANSIDGGASFAGTRVQFFDGMHNRGSGTGTTTGTNPWKRYVTNAQDSTVSTGTDGFNWIQRNQNFGTSNTTFKTDIGNAGGGSTNPYVSAASAILLDNDRVVAAVNRDSGGQPNVMAVFYERQSDGSYPNALVRDLSGKKTRADRSQWSLANPTGYAFIGRWGVGNVTASASSITFDDHSGHEFVGQLLSGSTQISYWSNAASGSSGENATAIYRSTDDKGLNGQGTAWKTTSGSYKWRNICVDPFQPERVLYVSNNDKSVIRVISRINGSLDDSTLKDSTGATVDLNTLILADFALRFPGGVAPPFPNASFSDIAALVSDPNMEGLFYAIVGIHGVPNVWMRSPTGDWVNISDGVPRSCWQAHVHPMTGDLILDGSMGRHVIPPPVGYPNITYKAALSNQLTTFYARSTVADPPSF